MPHFYFDLVDGEPVHDLQGIKLPDLAAAGIHAHKLAKEINKRQKGSKAPITKVVVKDGKFRPVLSVPLDNRD